MPFSDHQIVGFLLQQAREDAAARWRRNEAGYFVARFNGVDLSLHAVPAASGARIALDFSLHRWSASIIEPFPSGFFSPHYKSEDDRRLAASLQCLWAELNRRCAAPPSAGVSQQQKEAIFGRVLLVRVPHPITMR